jgi:hypothetical protein
MLKGLERHEDEVWWAKGGVWFVDWWKSCKGRWNELKVKVVKVEKKLVMYSNKRWSYKKELKDWQKVENLFDKKKDAEEWTRSEVVMEK